MISPEQVEFYLREGYLIKHALFSPDEVIAMKSMLNEEISAEPSRMNERLKAKGNTICKICELDIGQNSNHLWDDLDDLVEVDGRDMFFLRLSFQPKIENTVTALLGGEPELYLGTRGCVNKALSEQSKHWHQDNAWFRVPQPSKGLAIWIALDETITLKIVPQIGTMLCHDDEGSLWQPGRYISCAAGVENAPTVSCTVEAGSAVFFSFLTPHHVMEEAAEKTYSMLTMHFYHQPCERFFRLRNSLSNQSPYLPYTPANTPASDVLRGLFHQGRVYSMMDMIETCGLNKYVVFELMRNLLDEKDCCFEQISSDVYAQERARQMHEHARMLAQSKCDVESCLETTSSNDGFGSGQDDATIAHPQEGVHDRTSSPTSSEVGYIVMGDFDGTKYGSDYHYLVLCKGDTVSCVKSEDGWAFGQVLKKADSSACSSSSTSMVGIVAGWYPETFLGR